MKKIYIRLIFILLSLLWIAFIFSNSLENARESGEKSTWVYELVNNIFPGITPLFIRKMAHFTEFAILGFLFSSSAVSFARPSIGKRIYIYATVALPPSFIVAATDEFIQRFSEGRHSSFTDVLIDTAGALFGIIAFVALIFIIRHIKNRTSKKQQST